MNKREDYRKCKASKKLKYETKQFPYKNNTNKKKV